MMKTKGKTQQHRVNNQEQELRTKKIEQTLSLR